ncbi:hypothetical protein Godav_010123 [Gossypium davidsonii]|uniref:Uncharacterized protein n=1 Tax=Gossypium davidsonii TaxID=34287 RepID=A0A7J8SGB1_GOSDV|nr:hypothetical protein [Gossypium davidsonii]
MHVTQNFIITTKESTSTSTFQNPNSCANLRAWVLASTSTANSFGTYLFHRQTALIIRPVLFLMIIPVLAPPTSCRSLFVKKNNLYVETCIKIYLDGRLRGRPPHHHLLCCSFNSFPSQQFQLRNVSQNEGKNSNLRLLLSLMASGQSRLACIFVSKSSPHLDKLYLHVFFFDTNWNF